MTCPAAPDTTTPRNLHPVTGAVPPALSPQPAPHTNAAHPAEGGRRAIRRLAVAAGCSLLFYVVLFGLLLDRPLSLGFLQGQIEAKLARAATLSGRKLVILAGSNGPYSHRCEAIEPILKLPCVNGGVAVGIGLDYLFARWERLLRTGDLVYLPMEEAQYVRTRAATLAGPDAAIMLRQDRTTLASLPVDRWLGAVFSGDLRAAGMSVLEMALSRTGFHDPRAAATGWTNAWGDHAGHTEALAQPNAGVLATLRPTHPGATAIQGGDGAAAIVAFLVWARAHGVDAIGGLPTGFADAPIPPDTLAAIRAVYEDHGARFLLLPNQSRYPRSAFFDSADHLNETAQIVHSKLVARALSGSGTLAEAGR